MDKTYKVESGKLVEETPIVRKIVFDLKDLISRERIAVENLNNIRALIAKAKEFELDIDVK